jgi:hypothetical protein
MIILNRMNSSIDVYLGVIMPETITSFLVGDLKATNSDVSVANLSMSKATGDEDQNTNLHLFPSNLAPEASSSSNIIDYMGRNEVIRLSSNWSENTIGYILTDYQLNSIIGMAERLGAIEGTLSAIEKVIGSGEKRRRRRLDILKSIIER